MLCLSSKVMLILFNSYTIFTKHNYLVTHHIIHIHLKYIQNSRSFIYLDSRLAVFAKEPTIIGKSAAKGNRDRFIHWRGLPRVAGRDWIRRTKVLSGVLWERSMSSSRQRWVDDDNNTISRIRHSIEHTSYYTYSFLFLVIRAAMVSLMAAKVHTVAHRPMVALFDVPAAAYSIEVR